MTDGARRRQSTEEVPVLAWLLLAGAGIVLAVHVTRDWYQLFGPYLIVRPQLIAQALSEIAPFLLGAAIMAGAVRWSAGRRWLGAAVGVLALLGLMRLGSEIALALWMDAPMREPLQTALVALGLGASLAAAVAPALVAVGLHSARPGGATRRWLLATVIVLGAAGLLGGFALLAAWIAAAPDLASVVTLALPHGVLGAAAIAGTALVAGAAVRAAPRRGALPELLITTGATATALVLGWSAWFQVLLAVAGPDELMRYEILWQNLPVALEIIGVLCLATGFALGRAAPRRG